MGVEVHESGPLFDGRISQAMASAMDRIEEQVAQGVHDDVRRRLHEVVRHPTGYYEAHIQVDRQANDLAVTDTGIVYGPWLEGVGSRNRTTRFKGYATFRRVSGEWNSGKAREVADEVMSHEIDRMN